MTLPDLEKLEEWVNDDEALVRRGRFLTVVFLLEVGDAAYLVTVIEGRVHRVERGPFLLRSWTFAVRAPADVWQRFWEPVPAPGYHDLFALTKSGLARLDGNLQPLMANLQYVKDGSAGGSRRMFHEAVKLVLSTEGQGYLTLLAELGLLSDQDLEAVIERAMMAGYEKLSVGELRQLAGAVLTARRVDHQSDRPVVDGGDTVH